MRPKSLTDSLRLTAVTSLVLVCVGLTGAVMAHFGNMSGGSIEDGNITYSVDNDETGLWTNTLTLSDPSAAWYSRFEIGPSDYSGAVVITWRLQQKTKASTWTDVGGSTLTFIVLSGTAQNVYVTSNGDYAADNHNWGTDVIGPATYRVIVTVEPA